MKVRLLTSCTAAKAVRAPDWITWADFKKGKEHLARRMAALRSWRMPAGRLYAGRQHMLLMRAVTALRHQGGLTPEVWILSAGFGLVSENTPLIPYEISFSEMGEEERRVWAKELEVPDQVAAWLMQPSDLNVVLLGHAYLDAAGIHSKTQIKAPTLFFCSRRSSLLVPEVAHVKTVVLTQAEARRFRTPLISLKGLLAARLLIYLKDTRDVEHLMRPETDVLALLEKVREPESEQLHLFELA